MMSENTFTFGFGERSRGRAGRRPVSYSDLEVKQVYYNECTVMIWPSAGFIAGMGRAGHATVLLRKTTDEGPFLFDDNEIAKYRDPNKIRYISFWPSGMPDKDNKVGEFTSRRNAAFYKHHMYDYVAELGQSAHARLIEGAPTRPGQVKLWINPLDDGYLPERFGQLPTELIALPGLAPGKRTSLGLSMNKMVDWCVQFAESPDFNYIYMSTSNNCAGVAVCAISAGGGDAFAAVGGHPSKGTIYFTPNDAAVWARAVSNGILIVNNWISKLKQLSQNVSPLNEGNMPTVAEWKTASYKSWSIRGSETRGIDDALAVWHSCPRGEDAKTFPKKLDALVKLIKHTVMHMYKDPNSARDGAYRQLAQNILIEVLEMAQTSGKAWSDHDYCRARS